jgi:hypothetical protein
MLIKHMIPRHLVHLDEMTLGVTNLSDDVALCDPPRLRASADESQRIQSHKYRCVRVDHAHKPGRTVYPSSSSAISSSFVVVFQFLAVATTPKRLSDSIRASRELWMPPGCHA